MKPKLNPFAKPREPENAAEWQEAANLASLGLRLALARRWQLIGEDGQPNVKLCEERLAQAHDHGISPYQVEQGGTP